MLRFVLYGVAVTCVTVAGLDNGVGLTPAMGCKWPQETSRVAILLRNVKSLCISERRKKKEKREKREGLREEHTRTAVANVVSESLN